MRQERDQSQLCQLRRLHRERTELKPAAGAFDPNADVRNQHKQQQDQHRAEKRPDQPWALLQNPIIKRRRSPARHQPDGTPNRLHDEVVAAFSPNAGADQHDDTKRRQCGGGEEEDGCG